MVQAPNIDEQNVFLARVAEQAERFDDMVSYLEQVLESKGTTVNPDERNLVSVAFKNLVSNKRAVIRTINAIEQNPKYAQFANALQAYKDTIEQQLLEDYERIISIIQTKVLENAGEEREARIFFLKMIADYYRFISEIVKGDKREQANQQAAHFYE